MKDIFRIETFGLAAYGRSTRGDLGEKILPSCHGNLVISSPPSPMTLPEPHSGEGQRKLSFLFYTVYLVIFVFLLIGCSDKNYISNESQSIVNGAWKYDDNKAYSFNIADTSKVYNIYLSLNHAEDYAYQNLYLKIHTLFPSGKKMQQQVSFELADKYGKWYGDCGSKCDLVVDLQKGAYFNEVGKHTITLEQFMRKDPISGINELSLMVEETEVVR